MSVLGSFGSSDSSDISSMVSLSQYFISLGFTTIARFSNFCTNNITSMIKCYNCTKVGGWLTCFRLALYFFIRESCLLTSSKSSLSSNFHSRRTLSYFLCTAAVSARGGHTLIYRLMVNAVSIKSQHNQTDGMRQTQYTNQDTCQRIGLLRGHKA